MSRMLLVMLCACGAAAPPVAPAPAPAPARPAELTVTERGREPRALRYPPGAMVGEVRMVRRWTSQHTSSHRPESNTGLQLTPYVVELDGRCRLFEDGRIEISLERETGATEAGAGYPIELGYRRTPLALHTRADNWRSQQDLLPKVLPGRWPDEAVGVGARWSHVSANDVRSAWEVVALEGDRAVLRATTSWTHRTDGPGRNHSDQREDATIDLAIDLVRFHVDASRTSHRHGTSTNTLDTSSSSGEEQATVTIR